MIELLWLLLPVAAASGWWAARRSLSSPVTAQASSAEYFRGLNYLLDDKPDQAIEVFIRMADVDRETAETHLVLGNLFRRRGEVDRAIHIHSNLIAKTVLTVRQRSRAMLELGEDYLRAGLFDRAETLFRELVAQPDHAPVALDRLIAIYEQEKDWEQAIIHCDLLERMTGQSRRVEAAHFFCERAELALSRGDQSAVGSFLQRALACDPDCVRASILRGQMALAADRYQDAIAALQGVAQQNAAFFSEVIEPLGRSYAALGRNREFLTQLQEVYEVHPSGRLAVALVRALTEQEGTDVALHFLETELASRPSFLGLRCLVDMKLNVGLTDRCADLAILYQASRKMLDGAAYYQCTHCGFTGRSLHWHCPSCKCWNSIKPLPDLLYKPHV